MRFEFTQAQLLIMSRWLVAGHRCTWSPGVLGQTCKTIMNDSSGHGETQMVRSCSTVHLYSLGEAQGGTEGPIKSFVVNNFRSALITAVGTGHWHIGLGACITTVSPDRHRSGGARTA
ncbi:hypothetical protein EDC04DRAFT_314962 [Pisolithus marmoratus]|nr:hypothetical protein EDC04DRAFT_314962 [Pisolithus marmoratus]